MTTIDSSVESSTPEVVDHSYVHRPRSALHRLSPHTLDHIGRFADNTPLLAASMRECSPCKLLLGDHRPAIADEPYNTASCDYVCVGKWPSALAQFAQAIDHSLPQDPGFARHIQIRLNIDGDFHILKYYGAPGAPLLQRGIETYHAHRPGDRSAPGFRRGGHISGRNKDGVIWGDAYIMPVQSRSAARMPRTMTVEGYPLTLTTSIRPTVQQAHPAQRRFLGVSLPYNDREGDDFVTVGYSFPPKHVRIYSNRGDLPRGRRVPVWEEFVDPATGRLWEWRRRRWSQNQRARWSGDPGSEVIVL